jgi:starch synthase
LEGLLQSRAGDLSGIINGIDYKLWDPEIDKQIPANYTFKTIKGKGKSKLALQKAYGMEENEDIMLIGLISRLADQKGFDLIAAEIDRIMALGCQVVILGTGEPKYHELFEREHKRFPKQMGIALKFDAMLAQLIYAGSDAFLMPSRYEPCGLGQLISLKYGTIPIVRKTGGLADSIGDFDADPKKGTGFVFEAYNGGELFNCIQRAFKAYGDKKRWKAVQKNAMEADFSWDASAKKYVDMYKKAISKVK